MFKSVSKLILLLSSSAISLFHVASAVTSLSSWEYQPDPSCVLKELSPILDQCLYKYETVSETEKSHIAVMLSVCQLRVAQVSVPVSCQSISISNNDQMFDKCVAEFFVSPQYWTTYDGCFKFVVQGCLQESFRYEQERVIQLHNNITAHYTEFESELQSRLFEYSKMKKEALSQVSIFSEIYRNLSSVMESSQNSSLQFAKQLERQQQESRHEVERFLEAQFNVLDKFFLQKRVELHYYYEASKMDFTNVLLQFNDTLFKVQKGLLLEGDKISQQLQNAADASAEITSSIESFTGIIREFKGRMNGGFTTIIGVLFSLGIGNYLMANASISVFWFVIVNITAAFAGRSFTSWILRRGLSSFY